MKKPFSGQDRPNLVFLLGLAICLPMGLWGVLTPQAMADTVLGFTSWFMIGASWWWLVLCSSFVIFAAVLSLGPWGRIRLGADDDRPEFSTVSWIAMLFAGGMGAGLLFWGVAEPVSHFAAPPGQKGGTPAAARTAMVITNLHWGLHAWSIYGICALIIAYFTFRRGGKPLISTPLAGLFGRRAGRGVAVTADLLGVVAVVFGLAGSLAMGALQVRSGLASTVGAPETMGVALAILGVLTLAFLTSTLTGVEKGMKFLSNTNMVLALAIMLFIILFGPTAFIFESAVDTLGSYFSQLVSLAFRLLPYEGLTEWSASWTLTYLIWWLAWGPFVGVFIARISRGRTIREFCFGVILVPSLFSILWFAVFGGAGIYVELFGPGGLSALVADNVSEALFAFFGYFPLSDILSLAALALIFIFLVTSADSGTFVLSMLTTDGRLDPPPSAKLVWGGLVAIITAATLLSSSVEVARAMATLGAIPFSLILVLQIVGFLRALAGERAGSKPTKNKK